MTVRKISFDAIGTKWSIDITSVISSSNWVSLQLVIAERIEAFDAAYSRFRPDSLVSTMAKRPGEYELPPDGYRLLQFYNELYRATDGRVTPLVGKVLSDIGYDADYSLQPKAEPVSPPAWRDALDYTPDHIILKRPALLDFGAAGKGYLIDIIAGLLNFFGADSFVINAGGDMLHRGKNKDHITVGLENPLDTSQVIGTVSLGDMSLCASAGSRRKWSGYHHIIDPVSLASPQGIIATWVIAADTMTADGLATALFFTDPQKLMKKFDFSYALLDNHMELSYARDFPITPHTA
jgi:thiamine biosynthesis lipoprotein